MLFVISVLSIVSICIQTVTSVELSKDEEIHAATSMIYTSMLAGKHKHVTKNVAQTQQQIIRSITNLTIHFEDINLTMASEIGDFRIEPQYHRLKNIYGKKSSRDVFRKRRKSKSQVFTLKSVTNNGIIVYYIGHGNKYHYTNHHTEITIISYNHSILGVELNSHITDGIDSQQLETEFETYMLALKINLGITEYNMTQFYATNEKRLFGGKNWWSDSYAKFFKTFS